MAAAMHQRFYKCAGPVVRRLLEHRLRPASPPRPTAGAAAWVAAGLLLGAPDYAWGKEVPLQQVACLQLSRVVAVRCGSSRVLFGRNELRAASSAQASFYV